MAGLLQIGRHALAHHPQSDKADAHLDPPPFPVFVPIRSVAGHRSARKGSAAFARNRPQLRGRTMRGRRQRARCRRDREATAVHPQAVLPENCPPRPLPVPGRSRRRRGRPGGNSAGSSAAIARYAASPSAPPSSARIGIVVAHLGRQVGDARRARYKEGLRPPRRTGRSAPRPSFRRQNAPAPPMPSRSALSRAVRAAPGAISIPMPLAAGYSDSSASSRQPVPVPRSRKR